MNPLWITVPFIVPAALVTVAKVYDAVYSRWRRWQRDSMVKQRDEAMIGRYSLHTIYPDEGGRMPLVYGQDGSLIVRNPDTLAAWTLQAVQERYPELERLQGLIRMLEAAQGVSQGTAQELPAQIINTPLPSRIPLAGMLDGPPTYRDLLLGAAQDGAGQMHPVRESLAHLVHVAVGGITGWGKSVFLRALAYQLVKSADPIDVALVDLEGVTFAPFMNSERLLYPIADNEGDAKTIYRALLDEMERRKGLYARFPGVTSLDAYNGQADEQLRPIACLTDESTALFEDAGIESVVKTLILRARKYGLWLIMGGQDWKASSLDTAIREQFATRVQFKTMSATASRVLLQRAGAEELQVAGRALAWIPGHDMIEIQAPWIHEQDIINAISGNGPQRNLPAVRSFAMPDLEEQVKLLASEGLSRRQIALRLFGYSGGHAHERLFEILGPVDTDAQA